MLRQLQPVTITMPNGLPREGLRIDFHAAPPAESVSVTTAADGVFIATLETGVPYMVASNNAFCVQGIPYPAGTTFRVVVPEGEGTVSLEDVTIGIIDLSPPQILLRLEALEADVATLKGTT